MDIKEAMIEAPIGSVWWLGQGARFVVANFGPRWSNDRQGFGETWDVHLVSESGSGRVVATVAIDDFMANFTRVDTADWTPVEQAYPYPDTYVLVLSKFGVCVARYCSPGWAYTTMGQGVAKVSDDEAQVRMWRPLPSTPMGA